MRQSVVRKNVDRHIKRHSVVESHFAKSSHASRDDNATFSELTKSANEEPGGVLRNRNRSICVQPDDLRNARQLSWCEVNRDFGAVRKRNRDIPDVKTSLYVWNIMWRKCLCREEYIHYPPPQTCPSLVCIVKHILRDHATYMKQHASKRASIGRNESGDFQTAVGRFTVRSASVSAYPRFTGITIIRVYPLFPSLSPVVLSGYSIPTSEQQVHNWLTTFRHLVHLEGFTGRHPASSHLSCQRDTGEQ